MGSVPHNNTDPVATMYLRKSALDAVKIMNIGIDFYQEHINPNRDGGEIIYFINFKTKITYLEMARITEATENLTIF